MAGSDSLIADLPRATHVVLEGIDPGHFEAVDEYLSHYVVHEGSRCPNCGGGGFTWGVAWGAGFCYSCDWPRRLYHVIADARVDASLVCSATCNGYRVCEATRGEHVPKEVHWYSAEDGSPSSVETELRCPDPTPPPGLRLPFESRYKPPEIARFTMLLWAHPDFVVSR